MAAASDSDLAKELAHVNREMYKKNLELAERNETLSLLRKIDEIILSSVTDTYENAQEVSDTLVAEAEFKIVVIFTIDTKNKKLVKLAVSPQKSLSETGIEFEKKLSHVSLAAEDNLIVKTFKDKEVKVTKRLFEVLSPYFSEEECSLIAQSFEIKSTFLYPLTVREEMIGTMLICLGEDERLLSKYRADLISRLVGVVSIAIDNALLYQKIQDANRKLKELDRLKDEFVSVAAHQLRTPLGAMRWTMEMLLSGDMGKMPEAIHESVANTYENNQRMISLVNDLLDVSRIEAGRVGDNPALVDIREIIKEVAEELSVEAKENSVKIELELSQAVPKIMIDPKRLHEVISNLLSNSIKYNVAGGRAMVKANIDDSEIQISFEDTGIGIPKRDQERIFSKFFRAENAVRSATTGTGLGLFVVESYVKGWGGEVGFTSEERKGSTFWISLPIEPLLHTMDTKLAKSTG